MIESLRFLPSLGRKPPKNDLLERPRFICKIEERPHSPATTTKKGLLCDEEMLSESCLFGNQARQGRLFHGTWRGGFVRGTHLRWTETRRRRQALTAKASAEPRIRRRVEQQKRVTTAAWSCLTSIDLATERRGDAKGGRAGGGG